MGFYISEIRVVFIRFSPTSRQGEKGKREKGEEGKRGETDGCKARCMA
jgi:hypothetical protein